MKIEVSAPGKTILHGEHAVVYGKAAVAVSLGLRTKVIVLESDEPKISLSLKNFGWTKQWHINSLQDKVHEISTIQAAKAFIELEKLVEVGTDIDENELKTTIIGDNADDGFTKKACKNSAAAFLFAWLRAYSLNRIEVLSGCFVAVESELSVGAGMGSSASFAVCVASAALLRHRLITSSLGPDDKEKINELAFELESIFHGRPSGIDNSICTYGGALLFNEGTISEKLNGLLGLEVLLVDTKVPRDTKKLVQDVKSKKEQDPKKIAGILDDINTVSVKSWEILKVIDDSTDKERKLLNIHKLVNINQSLLNSLGVGHPKLNEIFNLAAKYGCAAKLTGAGGGGCAIILLPPKTDGISFDGLIEQLEKAGFSVWKLVLGGPGLKASCEDF